MKSAVIRGLLAAQRASNAPDIDGSYVLCAPVRHPEYEAAGHPAYTPRQIEAEKIARARPNVRCVYFIRDPERPAPYWLSPGRKRDVKMVGKTEDGKELTFAIPHIIIDVARSRDDRGNAIEVAIPEGQLGTMQPEKQKAFVLDHLRKAIAQVIGEQSRSGINKSFVSDA